MAQTDFWTRTDSIGFIGEYAAGIVSQLLKSEANFRPVENYLDAQSDINGRMRGILVDWLIEVHMKYRMRSETLFLTVRLVDLYLSRASVSRSRLQLIGVAAMSIAAKYEEINPPEMEDYVYITDNAYSRDDVIGMECQMLRVLDFQLTAPTAAHFLEPFLEASACDGAQKDFVRYLAELSLLEHRLLDLRPSRIVCSAIFLSNARAGLAEPWSALMEEVTGYAEPDLRAPAQRLEALLPDGSSTPQLSAAHTKYRSSTRHSVANGWPC